MKKLFLIACLFISFSLAAQVYPGTTVYVAAKTGLSMRETKDPAGKVVEKIPYGTKVTVLEDEGEWKEIVTEGLVGYWKKVKYNNKTGYVVDSYLFPWPPPKLTTIKELKQYLAQVSLPAGQKVVTKSGTMTDITEGGWELTKQVYKNGGEYHQFYAYEYSSDTYFLPAFSMQQGFLLCRLIPEFNQVFGEKDEFPTKSKKFTKDGREYEIKLISPTGEEAEYTGPYTIEKIKVSFEDGAYYEFELYMLGSQLVIFFGGGV